MDPTNETPSAESTSPASPHPNRRILPRLLINLLLLALRQRLLPIHIRHFQPLQRLLHRRLHRFLRGHHRAAVRGIIQIPLHNEHIASGSMILCGTTEEYVVRPLNAALCRQRGQAGREALTGLIEATTMPGIQTRDVVPDLLVERVIGIPRFQNREPCLRIG